MNKVEEARQYLTKILKKNSGDGYPIELDKRDEAIETILDKMDKLEQELQAKDKVIKQLANTVLAYSKDYGDYNGETVEEYINSVENLVKGE